MPITDEQRQLVRTMILRVIEEDYSKDFEPIYERAYQVLGDFPHQVSDEIRNGNNHNALALNADDYDLAVLSVERGRQHVHYAKHLTLLQMVSHELRYIENYVAKAEHEHGTTLGMLRDRAARIRLDRRKIAPVEIKYRDKVDELRADIQTMIEINTDLERLIVQINENRLYLNERFPLPGKLRRLFGKDAELPAVKQNAPKVPDQLPSPVRLEERNGKISQVGHRGSTLKASERDFEAWRYPIIEHIKELSSGDFREGTNHKRVRERLTSLDKLLPGTIADVMERQFRIGYEIERFEGLIFAYRSKKEDMPDLDAANLEDLDRLRLALKKGVDKLERWSEFHHQAMDDPNFEGNINPTVVGEALDKMAVEMEQRPKYFDPELPATFRFLAEAVKDPLGATKTIIYGAIKSIQNLISFLGQRALGIGKRAVEAVEEHISKGVAASLLLVLSGAALQLSGALPQGWTWLKPLLESMMKVGGG